MLAEAVGSGLFAGNERSERLNWMLCERDAVASGLAPLAVAIFRHAGKWS